LTAFPRSLDLGFRRLVAQFLLMEPRVSALLGLPCKVGISFLYLLAADRPAAFWIGAWCAVFHRAWDAARR
jgi:hypothetical protein